jgi:hypothetical protein
MCRSLTERLFGQRPLVHLPGEAESREVVLVRLQHVLAEASLADELLLPAVADPVGADDDEDNVGHLLGDALGRLHEDVEPAHELEAPGDVGDKLRPLRQRRAVAEAQPCLRVAPVEACVNALRDHLDLVLVAVREQRALVLVRAPPPVAILQVEHDHRVAAGAA